MSDSLPPHGLQHARLPCPSPSPRACSNPCPFRMVMPSNQLIFCHPLFLLPSIFPRIRVFSNESALHIRWPMYWSFSISPSVNIQDWFFFFRTDWFNFLAVQGLIRTSCGSEVFSCWDPKNKSILWKYKGEAFHLLLFLLLLLPLPLLLLFILLLCKRDIFFKAIKRQCI